MDTNTDTNTVANAVSTLPIYTNTPNYTTNAMNANERTATTKTTLSSSTNTNTDRYVATDTPLSFLSTKA